MKIKSIYKGISPISLKYLFRGDLRRFKSISEASYEASCNVRKREQLDIIPTISLDEILGARKASIRLTVIKYEDGMLPSHEALILASIAVAENPKRILEIGTFMGHTTRLLAENCPEAEIHTVDLPLEYTFQEEKEHKLQKDDFHLIQKRSVGREFKDLPCSKRIIQHFADTACWNFEEAGTPEICFIDGSHTYDYCRHDSEKCFSLMKRQGVIIWHDVDEYHHGVLRYLNECRAKGIDIRRVQNSAIGYLKL